MFNILPILKEMKQLSLNDATQLETREYHYVISMRYTNDMKYIFCIAELSECEFCVAYLLQIMLKTQLFKKYFL